MRNDNETTVPSLSSLVLSVSALDCAHDRTTVPKHAHDEHLAGMLRVAFFDGLSEPDHGEPRRLAAHAREGTCQNAGVVDDPDSKLAGHCGNGSAPLGAIV